MSRSRRHTKAITDARDFTKSKRKMPPYVGDNNKGNVTAHGKFAPEKDISTGRISRTAKLIAKNANRSLKKAARQQAKKQIDESL
jgi:hypothetical protein